MFYRLTDDLARRMVEAIKRYWAGHPRFKDLQVQGKFSFDERPQRGIVVKIGGANHQSVAADNYQGVLYSRAHLTTHPNHPSRFVEWVREDEAAVLAAGGAMPSPPGLYWVNAVAGTREGQMLAYVDAMLDREREILTKVGPGLLRTAYPPVIGSTRLWTDPGGSPLSTPEDYKLVIDGSGRATGVVQILAPLQPSQVVRADYRYHAGGRPPFEIREKEANWTGIPGVVICVGGRIEPGDVVGIVVNSVRRAVALEFSGRWEISVDIDIFARDVHDQRELTDGTAMYLWAILRSHWSSEGIEITNVALSGEGEEPYDENGDDYFYTANLSLTCTTEWYQHFPLDVTIRELAGPFATDVDRPGSPLELWNPEALRDPYFSIKRNPDGVH